MKGVSGKLLVASGARTAIMESAQSALNLRMANSYARTVPRRRIKMSEIRDRVKIELDGVVAEILRDVSGVDAYRYYTDKILSIPELAVIDREAELPKITYVTKRIVEDWDRHTRVVEVETTLDKEAFDALLKAGWVKEVEE